MTPTTGLPAHFRIRHPWRLVAVLGVAVTVGLIFAAAVPPTGDAARARLLALLENRFDGEVELREFRLNLFPRFRAEGRGLTIRHRGRRDVPPLISVERFSADGSVLDLLRHHIAHVYISGLDVEIPPDRDADPAATAADPPSAAGGQATRFAARGPQDDVVKAFVVDELRATEAYLTIIPGSPGGDLKVWAIHDLRMISVASDRALPFTATLTNAVPPGDIATIGTFGPWHSGEPGRTPLGGTFTFARADLGVFKGISGILSAHGTFDGVLAHFDVEGETHTPQFKVTAGGNPVPLDTRYHALVDGTTGNTVLTRVAATFLETSIVASGVIATRRGESGRTVTLEVRIDRGRVEDVLKLAVTAPSAPMVGALHLQTRFVLPPGHRDVIERLRLNGRFTIADARFTSFDIQTKLDDLSQRSRGRHRPLPIQHVTSQFNGTFRFEKGGLDIPQVTFTLPGTIVRLGGTYELFSDRLNFAGTVFMRVKLSQTTTGFKRLLLRVVDPLFRDGENGTAIPIRVTGKWEDPSFGLDKGRVFRRR
jgi:hypothetical protein